jgi:hypothetical protein
MIKHANLSHWGLLLSLAVSSAQATVVADFAADFSTTSATAGNWRYGSLGTLGGSFSIASNKALYGVGDKVVLWSPASTSWPSIGLNTGAAESQFGGGNVIHLAAAQGLLHPGPTGAFAVARLTVPTSFVGSLQVSFAGIDTVGTTTDVHVLLNGVSLYDGNITGFGQTRNFDATLSFTAGDQLDFAVGWGGNGHYIDDSTGFSATLSTAPVPEPNALALSVAALGALAAMARVRRKAQ